MLQTTLSTLNAAICVSNACRDNLILRAHLDPNKVTVIPNAVDPANFTPDPTRRRHLDRYVHSSMGINRFVGTVGALIPEAQPICCPVPLFCLHNGNTPQNHGRRRFETGVP